MRWKSLRDSYVKETKHKNAIANGEDKKPKRHWRYAQVMSFLAPFLGPPNPAKGVRRNAFHDRSIGSDELDPLENYYVTAEDLKQIPEDGSSPNKSDWEIFSPETHLVVSPIDDRGDDVDSFFRGIADTVKKLSPENQVKVQRDIVNMVLDIKLKEIGDRQMDDTP